ncbi:ABC transporter substrate-binding protein [Arcobacter sp. LA11]|uniref:ABC transporter substrate-binding protein n=1 Tax=Arcobacter sp. LA11 TaxID=1898176 RepID=UPI00093213C9|nr:ABC transporter substrate-binding protein [Arcobacter sp. LA11]
MRILVLIIFSISTIFSSEIKVGISAAFSGPAEKLGTNVRDGILTYFNKNNKSNTKHKFKLIAYDDGYEPKAAAKNMRKLIEEDKVLAVLGNVGTPTANVTVPIANEKKTLLFGAFTGAGVLRKNPPERYIINYRASYAQETANMINGLLSIGIKPKEIALFTQNDGYGNAGYFGVVRALNSRGLNHSIKKIQHGRYTRNTLNVEDGLSTILDSLEDIKAVIIVGAYAPAAKFIKLAKEDFPNAYFLNVSFVGSEALKNALGEETSNVIVTQVVPFYESDLPIVKEYLIDLKEYLPNAKPNFVSLEGYIVAKLFALAVNDLSSENISTENIINKILNMKNLDIGIGKKSDFNKNKYQFSDIIWPTIIKNNKFVELKWNELK